MKFNRLSIWFAFILAAGLQPFSAWAGGSSSSVQAGLSASSEVANGCVIASLDNLNFGTYTPYNAAPLSTSGSIVLRCTRNTVVSAAQTSGGSSLTGTGGTLGYTLYADTAFTKKLGQPATLYLPLRSAWSSSWNAPSNGTTYWSKVSASFTGHLTPAQVQALSPDFDPNQAFVYIYDDTNHTRVIYGYLGMSAPSSGSFISRENNTKVLIGADNYNSAAWNGCCATAFVLPAGSTQDGNTWSVAVPGDAVALTGVSAGAGVPMPLVYYAQIPGLQDVGPGAYADTVVMSVTF